MIILIIPIILIILIILSARRSDLIIINNNNKKITRKIVDFAVPADHRIRLKDDEKNDKYLDLALELKKHEIDNYTNYNWCFWCSH